MPPVKGYVGSAETYLRDLLHGFMEYGGTRGIKSFPAAGSFLWIALIEFLEQKHSTVFEKYVFNSSDSVPRRVDLNNAMFGLLCVCVERRGDLRMSLHQEALPVRDPRFFSNPPNFDEMVAAALEEAGKITGFLEY